MNRVINILTKRKKKEAKKKEKITTITNLFCLLFPGQDSVKYLKNWYLYHNKYTQ
jgi:hypothetical protein